LSGGELLKTWLYIKVKEQKLSIQNSGLMEGFNIVFFFSFVNNIGNIGNKLPGPFIAAFNVI
jgi:hypothetical protein